MVTTNSLQKLMDTLSNLTVLVNQKGNTLSMETITLIVNAINLLKPIAKYLQVELKSAEFMGQRFQIKCWGVFIGAVYVESSSTSIPLIMDTQGIYLLGFDTTEKYIFALIERQSEERLIAIVDIVHNRLVEAKEKMATRLQNLTTREQKLNAVKDFLKS